MPALKLIKSINILQFIPFISYKLLPDMSKLRLFWKHQESTNIIVVVNAINKKGYLFLYHVLHLREELRMTTSNCPLNRKQHRFGANILMSGSNRRSAKRGANIWSLIWAVR